MVEDSLKNTSIVNLTKIIVFLGISFTFILFIPLILQVVNVFPLIVANLQGIVITNFNDLITLFVLLFISILITVLILFAIFIFTIWLGSYILKKFNIKINRTRNQTIARHVMQISGFAVGFFLFSFQYISQLLVSPIILFLGVYSDVSFILNYFNILANLMFIPMIFSYLFVFANDLAFTIYRKLTHKKLEPVSVSSGIYSYEVKKKKASESKHPRLSKWLKVSLVVFIMIGSIFAGKIFFRSTVTIRFRFSNDFEVSCRNDVTNDSTFFNSTLILLAAPISNVSSVPIFLGEYVTQTYQNIRIFGFSPDLLPGTSVIDNIPKNFYYIFQLHMYFQFNNTEPVIRISTAILTLTRVQDGLFNPMTSIVPYYQLASFLSHSLTINKIEFDYKAGIGNVENATIETIGTQQFNMIDMLIYN